MVLQMTSGIHSTSKVASAVTNPGGSTATHFLPSHGIRRLSFQSSSWLKELSRLLSVQLYWEGFMDPTQRIEHSHQELTIMMAEMAEIN